MVISGCTELLEITDEKNRGRRDPIFKAVQKFDRLIRELVAYSRKQEMNPIALKVSTTVSEMEDILSTILGRNIAHVKRLNSDSAIFIDPAQVEQVLLNLASHSRTRCHTETRSVSRPLTSTLSQRSTASSSRAGVHLRRE